MTASGKHNPFETPPDVPSDQGISKDPSIEFEPHRQGDISFPPDQSERAAGYSLAASTPADTDAVDHSVWDEPGLSPNTAGPVPAHALTYSRWLAERIAATSPEKSWRVTMLVAVSAGLFAVVGSVLATFPTAQGIVLVCVVGPVTEEVMKVALAIWIVEKRPYLFQSTQQIMLCALAGGVVFSVVENLLYLNVYIPNSGIELVRWRWTVCVAMHGGCSVIAGMGLARIWSDCITHRHRPRLSLGSSPMVAAILIHAVYNCFAMAMSLAKM